MILSRTTTEYPRTNEYTVQVSRGVVVVAVTVTGGRGVVVRGSGVLALPT